LDASPDVPGGLGGRGGPGRRRRVRWHVLRVSGRVGRALHDRADWPRHAVRVSPGGCLMIRRALLLITIMMLIAPTTVLAASVSGTTSGGSVSLLAVIGMCAITLGILLGSGIVPSGA